MNISEMLPILRTSSEGSRFLSDDVLLTLGWELRTTRESIFTKVHTWISPVGIEYLPEARPCPTTDLTAGIKWMIPEGFSFLLQTNEREGHFCMIWETENPPRSAQMIPGATLELALAIAAFDLKRTFL
jgi:hypothetical protein